MLLYYFYYYNNLLSFTVVKPIFYTYIYMYIYIPIKRETLFKNLVS